MAARANALSDWNVIGHEWAVRVLTRAVSVDRTAHAYLFTGPHSIGKTTMAHALAQALECTGQPRPCGECAACHKIARDRHPDVQLVEGVPPRFDLDRDQAPAPRATDWERRTLRIRQIRDVEHFVARSPFEGRWKIVILRRFEEAEDPAANAFLKTLEEPPKHTRLILTARDASLLLPTIASRCQVFPLRPLSIPMVETALKERWGADEDKARLLARLSGGRLGWAVRASVEPSLTEARTNRLAALDAVLRDGRAERLNRAGELAKEAESLPDLLEQWVGWWRDVLLIQNGEGARVINVDREQTLRDHAARYSQDQVRGTLQSLRAASHQLSQNVNPRLAIEVLLQGLPGMA
ncbi:MAG: DNA polymerase III subunit [Chloroflexi bacterium]|nr:DNA polymerase III subunit [Chloroflexota bacterium]